MNVWRVSKNGRPLLLNGGLLLRLRGDRRFDAVRRQRDRAGAGLQQRRRGVVHIIIE